MNLVSRYEGREGRRAVSSMVLVVVVIVVLVVAGTLSYFVFASGALSSASHSSNSTNNSTDTLQTSQSAGSQSGSSVSTSGASTLQTTISAPSTTISIPASTASSSQGAASTSSASTLTLPSGSSEVIIPEGIQNANAKQQNITFDPYNLKVVIGVNNTIYFVNKDMQDNLGHVLESISWPTGGQGFQFFILPGQVYNVTLTTPGTYNYNCEWHPVWMTGTIVVLPHA